MNLDNDPEWQVTLEKAKAEINKVCQHMVKKELPNGNILQYRCKKKAKYIISGSQIPTYNACVEHATEMRSRPDVKALPHDPKLIVLT